MPGSVTIVEALGAPSVPASQDFAVCVVGCSTTSPILAGRMSPPYSSPSAAAGAYGLGDGIDCVTQAITVTRGNPKPPPVCFYRTPATTLGIRGATSSSSFASGRVSVAQTASTHPVGTYEPRGRVKTSGRLGTAGIVLELSPDAGRTWLPAQALGTATTIKMLIGGVETGVQWDFAFSGLTGSGDITDSGLYGVGGDLDGLTLILNVNGGGSTTLTLDGATNTANKAALLAAIHSTWAALTATDVSTHLHLADSVASGSIVVGAGTANTLIGLTAGTYGGDMTAGDIWTESITTPPMWAVSDLYTAGSPPTGALAAIGQSSTAIAIVALTEPVAAGDMATISAGLDYLVSRGKRVWALARFRPRTAEETDEAHSAAFATFCAAWTDDRITIVRGEGWLTDAYRAFRYFRSGLPALLARIQSFEAVPGERGERMAQHPGWGARGELEGFSLIDDAGTPLLLAHDEKETGGTDGPFNGLGGGCAFYYEKTPGIQGTYVSELPVRHPALGRCLTGMDRRVINGIETVAQATLFLSLQGADLLESAGQGTAVLDAAVVDAQGAKCRAAIKDRYSREFQNPDATDLVVVNPTATLDGSKVGETALCKPRLYGYTESITLTVAATR